MISCANKILSRSNNILSRRNKLKNKTRMSLPGFRRQDTRMSNTVLNFTVMTAGSKFYLVACLATEIHYEGKTAMQKHIQ